MKEDMKDLLIIKFVFIRQINRGRYSIPLESLENNYNNEISDNFILLDNSISSVHIAY